MDKKYVWVTRPKEEYEQNKTQILDIIRHDQYLSENYQIIAEPLIEIEIYRHLLDDNTIILSVKNANNIILTSINALKFLSYLLKKYDINTEGKVILVIGNNLTKYTKEKIPLANIINAGENIEEMLEFMSKNKLSENTLYLRGEDITFDIKAHLGKGMTEFIVYKAHLVNNLSNQLIDIIKKDDLKMVVFYSSRTASNFIRLMKEYGLEKRINDIYKKCLSNKIARLFASNTSLIENHL